MLEAPPLFLPHLTKGSSHLFGEKRWLFERGEVTTSVEFIPIKQVRPQCLGLGAERFGINGLVTIS
jgi:hypothetical protein